MIKSFQIMQFVRTQEQFKALVKLLKVLEADMAFAGENEFYRNAAFLSSNLKFEVILRKKKTSKHLPYSGIHLQIYVTDPDAALTAIKKNKLRVTNLKFTETVWTRLEHFIVVLPGELSVWIVGQTIKSRAGARSRRK